MSVPPIHVHPNGRATFQHDDGMKVTIRWRDDRVRSVLFEAGDLALDFVDVPDVGAYVRALQRWREQVRKRSALNGGVL